MLVHQMVFPGKFESVMLKKSHDFSAFLGLTRRALRGRVSDASFLAARELSKLENSSFFLSKIYYTYLHAMYHQFQYIDTNMNIEELH